MENEYFKLKVPIGSEIIGANFNLKLNTIPDNVLDLWKKGAKEFEIKKEGFTLLESITYSDLVDVLEIRVLVGYRTEIALLKKWLRAKADDAKVSRSSKNSD